jgi:hypothetical protein
MELTEVVHGTALFYGQDAPTSSLNSGLENQRIKPTLAEKLKQDVMHILNYACELVSAKSLP